MLNSSIMNLGVYASKSIARQVEGNADIVSLSIGEPVFGPPPAARVKLEALLRTDLFMSDMKRYETSAGSSALRESIAGYYKQFFGLAVAPGSQVMVTNGGAGALTAAILATTNPGDEVLIGDPSYMLYYRLVTVLGRKPVALARDADQDYTFDPARVKRAITDRTAAIIVNSPENPTGRVCGDDELKLLIRICESRGLTLIHDEVYDQFRFEQPHKPAGLLGGFDNVVQINSMSKKFGVPGLRVGWLVSNAKVISLAGKAQDYTTLAVNAFGERVAEALLQCPSVGPWFAEMRADLRTRVALTVERLSTVPGVEFPSEIAGGMFAFPSVTGLARHLGLPEEDGAGDAVAKWMLEHARVAVVPGSVYGKQGRDAVRLVLCGPEPDLRRGLDRIEQAAAFVRN